MLVQAKDILAIARAASVKYIEAYAELMELLAHAAADPKVSGLSDEELVDVIRVLRDVTEIWDRLRIESKKLGANLEEAICLKAAHRMVNDDDPNGFVISTPYAKAQADIKAGFPVIKKSKNPDLYASVMRWLGVPEELIELGALEPHWEGMKAIVAQKMAAGAPLPEGLNPDQVYFKTSLRVFRRADPLTDEPGNETEVK